MKRLSINNSCKLVLVKTGIRVFFAAKLLLISAYLMTVCATVTAEIVIVKSKDIPSYESAVDGIKSVVKETVVEYDMEGDIDKGQEIIKKIKKKAASGAPPSAILTIGMMASRLIKEEITNAPVIFCMVINPAQNGLTDRQDAGGVSMDISPESQLTNLRRILPSVVNLGVIYNPENSGNIIEEAKRIASALNINLIAEEVSSEKKVPAVLLGLVKTIDVLWLIADPMVLSQRSFEFISLTAMERRIPVFACSQQLVRMGLPFSFYADEFSMGKQAGLICQKVLNGEIRGPIPVESPQDVYLAVNLITMKKCGINLSQEVIDTAKEVYR